MKPENKTVLDQTLKECNNNPGMLKENPNCVNAAVIVNNFGQHKRPILTGNMGNRGNGFVFIDYCPYHSKLRNVIRQASLLLPSMAKVQFSTCLSLLHIHCLLLAVSVCIVHLFARQIRRYSPTVFYFTYYLLIFGRC